MSYGQAQNVVSLDLKSLQGNRAVNTSYLLGGMVHKR